MSTSESPDADPPPTQAAADDKKPPERADPTGDDQWLMKVLLLVVVVGSVVVFAFMVTPWSILHAVVELLDAAVLLGWGILDLRKFRRHRDDKMLLRDGLLQATLGLLTVAAFTVGYYRDLPRTLTPKQLAAISSAMEPLRGTDMDMQWQAADYEADHFARQLQAALEGGGIQVRAMGGLIFGPVADGINISMPRAQAIQDAFEQAFRAARIQANGTLSDAKRVVIIVGAKPK
jgi:hypothetical protein